MVGKYDIKFEGTHDTVSKIDISFFLSDSIIKH